MTSTLTYAAALSEPRPRISQRRGTSRDGVHGPARGSSVAHEWRGNRCLGCAMHRDWPGARSVCNSPRAIGKRGRG